MSEVNHGGQAFPGEQGYTPQGWNQTYESGMTLRQWYAGQAINALMLTQVESAKRGNVAENAIKELVENAFEIADALIKEGEK